MRFFADVREAVFAGYRACLRCDPLSAYGQQPAWVTRLLKALAADSERRFKDADLRRAGLEPATGSTVFPEALRHDVSRVRSRPAPQRRLPAIAPGRPT